MRSIILTALFCCSFNVVSLSQVLQLDGTSGTYAEVPVNSSSPIAGSPLFTIECWLKDEGSMVLSGSRAPLCSRFFTARSWLLHALGQPNSTEGGAFGTSNCGTSSGCWESTTWTTNAALLSGKWVHYAGVRTATEVRLYVNGCLQNVILASPNVYTGTSDPMVVGAQLYGTSSLTKGKIDELRFWSTARTEAQIAGSMFQELDNLPGLVGSWHFNGNFLDSTGGNHAIPRGNAVIHTGDIPTQGTGQANSSNARFEVNGSDHGILRGPFESMITRGQYFTLSFSGSPNSFYEAYASNTLTPGGWDFGSFGLFDLGTGPLFPDVFVLLPGFSGATPFYALDAAGQSQLSFYVHPSLPLGPILSIQALIQKPQPWSNGQFATLTAAHTLLVQ